MKTRIICVGGALALLLGGIASAEPACDNETESLEACFARIVVDVQREESVARTAQDAQAKELIKAADVKGEDATAQKLADTKTGADTGGAATANSLTDLAPIFDALGLLSSDEASGNQLAFNLNFLLPVQDVENKNTQLQLVVNTQPEPLDQLVQAFDESVRETRKDELQKEIPTFGDQELKFSWSLRNTRFGRDYQTLRGVLSPIYEGAFARSRKAKDARDNVAKLRDFPSFLTANRISLTQAQGTLIKDLLKDGMDPKVVTETIAAASARENLLQLVSAEIARANLDSLTELVDQQPQLLFGLSHNFRDEIVGPEETSATLTWEMTRRNLGNFLHGSGAACLNKQEVEKGDDGAYTKCVAALENYLTQDLKDQWRLKLEASYKRVDALSYSFPDDDVALDLPKTKRVEVTFGGGRDFTGKPDLGHLDFELSYDSNVDNDSTNKDRLRVAITLTRRVGGVDVPFSIVYANRNEFLGEVDHQISMHIGIKFRQTGK
jgi:hypothetical protein